MIVLLFLKQKICLSLLFIAVNYIGAKMWLSKVIINTIRLFIALIDLVPLVYILASFVIQTAVNLYRNTSLFITGLMLVQYIALWLVTLRDRELVLPILKTRVIALLLTFICYLSNLKLMFILQPFAFDILLYSYAWVIGDMLNVKFKVNDSLVIMSKYVAWIDPLILGYKSREECALKNTCVLLFGLINLIYGICWVGNIYVNTFLCLSLCINIFIGLRLAPESKNIKMYYEFMTHMIIGCYENILTIWGQLKTDALAKRTLYTWISIIMLSLSCSSAKLAAGPVVAYDIEPNTTVATIELANYDRDNNKNT